MYVETDDVREVATQMTETKVTNGALASLIIRASRMFDLVCGVQPGYFEAVASGATATAQTIYGSGGNFLKLPPYVSISTVTFPTGYTALEYVVRDGYLIRADALGLTASPNVTLGGWYEGVPITVTAIWGYSATPEDVKHAIIEWVINLFRETDPAETKITNLDGSVLREKIPPRVGEVARRYRIKEAVFV